MERKITYNIYNCAVMAGGVLIMVLIMKNPVSVTVAARRGMELCTSTMIPTLFPFFVLTSFLSKSGAIKFFGNKTGKVSSKLFKLPGNALGIFLISLVSGFPVGASMASSMMDEGTLTKAQSARLMSCCVNAGPAFVISAVGTEMFHSRRAGIILFASLTISSVLIFFASGLFSKEERLHEKTVETPSNMFCASLVGSVTEAASSMASVCGWIIIFSCITTFFGEKMQMLTMFFEVSLGCKQAANYPLPVTALVIGWGGVCVHCQVFHAVVKSEMRKINFFFFRALNGALSAGICSVLLRLFPCAAQTFGSVAKNADAKFSSNAVACAGLLLMCAILIVDFEESRNREGQNFIKNQKAKKFKNLR